MVYISISIYCFVKLNILTILTNFRRMSALKTFRVKVKLSKKMKQNRPIPQWIR